MFEKDKSQRSAINITISGIGVESPTIIDQAEDIGYTINNSEKE
jgi:hypothetical protein